MHFRPLIGVNFCKQCNAGIRKFNHLVSVPLSGLTSVNEIGNGNWIDGFGVSVPLSGLAFINMLKISVLLFLESFRPLIGVSFCKLMQSCYFADKIPSFSSPYRG